MTKKLPNNQIVFYQTTDGLVNIEVLFAEENIWLTQKEMAELFDCSTDNISLHLKNIYKDSEVNQQSTTEEFSVVRQEGTRQVKRTITYYNLDAIISVGYRVKSLIATRFRIWATERLKEYIVKGFAMDDERLKQSGGGGYFDELLARIRDIRSSEKVFWRKVLDIYATSIDYDPKSDVSREFFKIIQNKMHWAAHGQTAAEIIYRRVDASRPNMGLTNWVGSRINKNETESAKNYLTDEELELLNRIVSLYLDFAELQAVQHKAMTMLDWISKLDDFLQLSGRELLTHAGTVSHEVALTKAHEEYEKFRLKRLEEPTEAEAHFIEAEREIKRLESAKKRGGKKK